jgi:hypothetical protein
MTRSILLALTTFGLLSACAQSIVTPPPAPVFGGQYSQSIGFTGIGPEPF